ncbi:capsule-associated protein-like protein CAP1 [Corynespora cassiicola Philippines]|uniref:Capsule-associated protein-like protein CAP1 n=1 Tax=Corynespora cassiicola Philippines TaxID=1448308 RepID=A0A2T2P3V0_CORCC|nr:capsule-associated protein-like protein CAP1 [Corynespora cassiicola Philippines]
MYNLPRRPLSPRLAFRTIVILACFFILSGTVWLWHGESLKITHLSATATAIAEADGEAGTPTAAPEPTPEPTEEPEEHDLEPERLSHPIDYLIQKAEARHKYILEKQSNNLASAAAAYRKKRGRHPPPGFDEWFKFAQEHDAVIVEDFFDQIYQDLTPYWGLEAADLRRQAKGFPHLISVRNGVANMTTDKDRPWMDLWLDLTRSIQKWLPDVDIPINVMDESRVIAPWDEVDRRVREEGRLRKMVQVKDVVGEYTGLKDVDEHLAKPTDVEWITTGSYWDAARVGCPPQSMSRNATSVNKLTGPPPMHANFPPRSFEGYVLNWTTIRDPCWQPELRESHGTFVEPVSQSTTHTLMPLFGGSKLPMNNDILLPPAMYWSDDVLYSGGDDHGPAWEKKEHKLMWRGAATGGRNRESNWTRFHRHRFVSMVNGSAIQEAERNVSGPNQGPNFVLQSYRTYNLRAVQHTDLGSWLSKITDVGFVSLDCFPQTGNAQCPYTDHYFSVKKPVPMKEQYSYKYLADLDGNSFSGRYLGFLRSTSVPIKASIYSEWHDSRLTPWLHFVPMDNSYVDVYGILDYFMGTSGTSHVEQGEYLRELAHDRAGKKIALAGKEWAEKVLRKEDMQIYVMRLLMEYARVCDDKREVMGYVKDLEERIQLD